MEIEEICGFNSYEINFIETIKKSLDNQIKEEYSIFDVEEVGEKEVIMCRVLADFLNPKGKHNQGIIYLKCFYELLNSKLNSKKIKITYNCNDKDDIKVIKEKPVTSDKNTNTKKRIDIVINNKTEQQYIPIEVKINADEQNDEEYSQCQFYLNNAKKMYRQCEKARLIFLTKDGHKPNTIVQEEDKNKVICLSWEKDIINWIDNCIKNTDEISIVHIFKQLRLTISRFTNNLTDKEFELIKEQINDSNNKEIAESIKNNLLERKKFLDKIEENLNSIATGETGKFQKNGKHNEVFFDTNDCIKNALFSDLENNEGFVFGKLLDGFGFGFQINTSNEEQTKRNELLNNILSNIDYEEQEDWGIWINKIFYYECDNEKLNAKKIPLELSTNSSITNYINAINNYINDLKYEKYFEYKDFLRCADKISKVYQKIK